MLLATLSNPAAGHGRQLISTHPILFTQARIKHVETDDLPLGRFDRCSGSEGSGGEQPGTVPMKKNTDTGFIVSLHHDGSPNTLRVNLKWEGDHDISAFDLGSLGEVLHCENESENTGWAIVRSSHLVSPGDAIPLRKRAENLELRNRNSSRLSLFQISLFQR